MADWMIYFEDASMRPEVFTDEVCARERVKQLEPNWNIRLLVSESELRAASEEIERLKLVIRGKTFVTAVPGTYEHCMRGHYFAVVRGDEECPSCKACEERDAAIQREAKLREALKRIDGLTELALDDPLFTIHRVAQAALSESKGGA